MNDRGEWRKAKRGEIWVLTYGGKPTAHVVTDRWAGAVLGFVSDRAIVEMDDPDIRAGYRIWPDPEQASSSKETP